MICFIYIYIYIYIYIRNRKGKAYNMRKFDEEISQFRNKNLLFN
jgi:hypothetical protein